MSLKTDNPIWMASAPAQVCVCARACLCSVRVLRKVLQDRTGESRAENAGKVAAPFRAFLHRWQGPYTQGPYTFFSPSPLHLSLSLLYPPPPPSTHRPFLHQRMIGNKYRGTGKHTLTCRIALLHVHAVPSACCFVCVVCLVPAAPHLGQALNAHVCVCVFVCVMACVAAFTWGVTRDMCLQCIPTVFPAFALLGWYCVVCVWCVRACMCVCSNVCANACGKEGMCVCVCVCLVWSP